MEHRGSLGRRAEAVVVVQMLATGWLLGFLLMEPGPSSAYTPRAPILIRGNAEFTAANGVTGGSGTPSDPYVIEGWEINASTANGIEIRNTDAHLVIRDCYVYWGWHDYEGTLLYSVRNVRIENISAEFNADGIYVEYSPDIILTRNVVASNYRFGISISYSPDAVITANTAVSNYRHGIVVAHSPNSTLIDNKMLTDSLETFGLNLESWNTHTIDTTNTVNGRPIYYWKNIDGGTVPAGAGEVILANCTNVRVEAQNISGGSLGILLGFSNFNTIANNILSSNSEDGIYLLLSDGNTITNNTVSNSLDGIQVILSSGNLVANNTASGNSVGLLFLSNFRGNTIVNNVAFSNGIYGIFHAASTGDMIADNMLYLNDWDGIYFEDSWGTVTMNNTIFSNDDNGIHLKQSTNITITNNKISANVMSGIYIESSTGNLVANNTVSWNELPGIRIKSSTGNQIHHNNMINNTPQAFDDRGTENLWDNGYPSGGNFWSDYTGIDIFSGPNQNLPGNDGIGDTPYVIDTNSTDRYPLMTPTTSIDIVPPTVSITSPTDGQVFTSPPVTVTGTASDTGGSGLKRVEVRLNGGPWMTAIGLGSWSIVMNLTPGFNIINARSLDNDWNPSSIDSVNVTYSNPPSASFTVSPLSGSIATTFNVDATSSTDLEDPTTILQVRWDWENDGMWDTMFTTTKTAQHQYATPSTYSIRMEVRDTVGFTDSTVRQVWVNNTAPVAAFNVSPYEGNLTTVFFFDASSCADLEDPVATLEVRWDWEDDGTWDTVWDTAKTDNHQYASLGTYTIRLEVRDSAGLADQAIAQVWVNNTAPKASFVAVPSSGNVTTKFVVDASSSSDLEDPTSAIEVRWDWEDDGTWDTVWDTAKTANHQYFSLGSYTIRLEVRDSAGLTDQTIAQVWVNNTAPRASFLVAPVSGNVTTTFTMDAIQSSDLEDPSSALQVRWDWEDDGIWDVSWSTAKSAQHTYAVPGAYTIRMQVRDTAGATTSTTRRVWVNNTSPRASFTVTPMEGNVATAFTVDASSSSDLEESISSLQTRWDWEDDGVWDTSWSTAKTAQHQYSSVGVFTIRLEVKDTGALISQATRLVYVNNTPPEASFTVMPVSGNTTTSFTVDASASLDLEDSSSSLQVRWDWDDDGTWDTNWSTTKTASHQYANPGSYVIRLEVQDTEGLINSTTKTVSVSAPPETPSEFPWWILFILIALLVLIILILLKRRKRARAKPLPKAGESSERNQEPGAEHLADEAGQGLAAPGGS